MFADIEKRLAVFFFRNITHLYLACKFLEKLVSHAADFAIWHFDNRRTFDYKFKRRREHLIVNLSQALKGINKNKFSAYDSTETGQKK